MRTRAQVWTRLKPSSVGLKSIFWHFFVIFMTDLLKYYRKSDQNSISWHIFVILLTDLLNNWTKIGWVFNFQTFACHFQDWITKILLKIGQNQPKSDQNSIFRHFFVIFLTDFLKYYRKSVEYSIFRHFYVILLPDLLKKLQKLIKINENRLNIQFPDISMSFYCLIY